MSISDPASARAWREIAMIAAAATLLGLVLSPRDPTFDALPVHPMWMVALVLSARHGARGLAVVPVSMLGMAIANLVTGGATAALARLSGAGDLAALATTMLCAIAGTSHARRTATLAKQLRETEARAQTAEAAVAKLSETAIALRTRSQRCDTSLSFLAEVASRIDGRDPKAAAEAALDLVQARTGARGGFVQTRDARGTLSTLACRGVPILRDLTATAALERGVVVSADEIAGARPEDSDLAAPLVDEDGLVIGVLALHGVPYALLSATVRSEIDGVARWVSRSIASNVQRDATPVRKSGTYSFAWGKRDAKN